MLLRILVATGVLVLTLTEIARAQDVTKGEIVFHQCVPCHSIGANAQNKVGPELNGLDGRHSGTVANFDYSDANKNSGIVWNEGTFKTYIVDPKATVPGTKMSYRGVKDPQQVNDLWAYIRQFNTDGGVNK
jgi:cytochrome c